jgi:hypothetical protein
MRHSKRKTATHRGAGVRVEEASAEVLRRPMDKLTIKLPALPTRVSRISAFSRMAITSATTNLLPVLVLPTRPALTKLFS